MLPLNNMGDKASPISSLRLVRTAAVKDRKSLKEEEKRICPIFPQMSQQRQHRGGNFHQYEGDNTQGHESLYYNSQSVAESTL